MVRMITVRDVFETNCYFYIDEKTQHGFLIDAGAQGKEIAGRHHFIIWSFRAYDGRGRKGKSPVGNRQSID